MERGRSLLLEGSNAGVLDTRHTLMIGSFVRMFVITQKMRKRQGEGEAWLHQASAMLERGDLEGARVKFAAACEASPPPLNPKPGFGRGESPVCGSVRGEETFGCRVF